MAEDFRTKNTRLPVSPEDFATGVLQHHAQPSSSAFKHTLTKKIQAALPFARPEGRINPVQQLDSSLAAHEEVVRTLLVGSSEFASPDVVDKAKADAISTHMLRSRTDKDLEDRVDGGDPEAKPWYKQQLYPRRWYDSIMPVNLPFESRETVAQARSRLQVLGDAAAWRTERNARPRELNVRFFGTCIFLLVVLTLALLPVIARIRMEGASSAGCYDPVSYLAENCEVIPYPRLAVYCAVAIILLFKISTLDMTVGPYGALPMGLNPNEGRAPSLRFVKEEGQHTLPRVLSGAVPECEREGIYGYVERFVAIWHGTLGATAIALLILLVDFTKRMQDDYVLRAMTGGALQNGAVILATPGTLDDNSVDLNGCITVTGDTVTLVASEFFGVRNLVLFMFGAILFGFGEMFKLRAVQLWPMKGLIGFDALLRISKPWIWSREVAEVNALANQCADMCWKQLEEVRHRIEEHDEVQSFQKAAKENSDPLIHQKVEELCELTCAAVQELMSAKVKSRNIGLMNRSRILWAAAFQTAGISLWVPASQAELAPCLREFDRWSLVHSLVPSVVDRLELLTFGSICVLVAAFCFLVYMPFIPFNLQSMMVCNPGHWHVDIPALKAAYQNLHPAKYWLSFVVDGLLLIFIGSCVFFGQLGSDWVVPEEDQTWFPLNPWGLWRYQVILYALELIVRWIGSNVMTGRGIVRPSLAEEAAYTAQVQNQLLETMNQVGDAGGPFHDVQNMLGNVSARVRNMVYDSNKATKFESSSESEEGEPVHGWAKLLTKDPSDNNSSMYQPQSLEDGFMTSSPGPSAVQEFIIDNRWLKAQTDGLGYRLSKNMEDHDLTRPVAPWFSSVFGTDHEDGWVQLEDGGFLPSFVNECPVLTVPQDAEAGHIDG
eukprot:gb/GFBE01012509.1/.p1 GENE.gb/GFBE01012509.1/~~gb/GFBE01012509.1/.p1  ORF type:complete len:890 (+),score=199.04 gb/GFBE01012509.1/:1-2670(+)